jgi:hypothetical protein
VLGCQAHEFPSGRRDRQSAVDSDANPVDGGLGGTMDEFLVANIVLIYKASEKLRTRRRA